MSKANHKLVMFFGLSLYLGACSAVPPEEGLEAEADLTAEESGDVEPSNGDAPDAPQLGVARQALTGTHKLCSVIDNGNFRDSFIVPNGWDSNDCKQFCITAQADVIQLGCVVDNGFIMSAGTAGCNAGGIPLPNPNPCGWF